VPVTPDQLRLDGRVAMVTGAARGIGAAVAETFAAWGASLALCDREGDDLAAAAARCEATGAGVVADVLDVRDDDAVARFVARLERVDVLVNNAGGGFHAPFLDVSAKGEDALVRENFTSVSRLVRLVVPRMPSGGSIVNVTSVEAHRAAPGFAVYAAMKAAVENLTRSLALELGERGIRVNCVAPDMIPTPGIGPLEAAVGADGEATELPTPLGHVGHVDDVAAAVLYLASDLARFVTGQTIHVDGGTWAAGGWRRRTDGTFRP
jgi:3-oxoacyl-[acyl-carrier protein] reductase